MPVVVVNPAHVHPLAQALGKRAKTDPIDAMVIAHFAAATKLDIRPLKDEATRLLADLVTRRRQIIEMTVAERQRQRRLVEKHLQKSIARLPKALQKELAAVAPQCRKSGEMSFQLLRQIGLFPGKTAFSVRRAAEMAIGGGARIDWPIEPQMLPDAARGKAHDLEEGCLEFFFRNLARSVGIDIDRQRLGDADRVGKLNRAAIGETRGNDVFGEVTGGIGCRAIDLRWILARKCAASMWRRPAIGVDDNFAAGQTAIAVGTADHEFAGRVDVPNRIGRDPAFRQDSPDMGFDNIAHVLRAQVFVEMLR